MIHTFFYQLFCRIVGFNLPVTRKHVVNYIVNEVKLNYWVMPAKVFIVDYQSQADYKVFFVDYASQETNHQIIANGKLVSYASQADCKVYIVDYASQADIKILRKNFPKG